QEKYVMHTYNRDLMLVRGEGSRVWDAEGNEYLDFTMGIAVCNLGHCHPRVTAAIREQAGKLVHVSNLFYNENQPLLAAAIATHSFGGKVFFCNSGAEANEGQIKFARKWGSAHGGRHEIICMDNSFHGRTLATLAATGRAKYRVGFAPDVQGFRFATFNDLESVKAQLTDLTVAVMLEPVQGEGGIIPGTPDFIQGVRQFCDEHKLLLLLDEVQCGMGRTGKAFAYQHYGIEPDSMSMAKALGNGLPLAAFEVQQKHSDVLQPGMHASTFGGTPLACAAGLAVFETFDRDNVLENATKMGEWLTSRIRELQAKYPSIIREIRGKGLMLGVDVGEYVKPLFAACRQQNFLVLTAGETVLRLMPALTLTEADAADAIQRLDKALSTL
ncbi:MAG: aspartate aminotransferase family protein, partial [Victivallales bacterium]|nr:aspartate aminotransferase family protein [Victivallales bacterium]